MAHTALEFVKTYAASFATLFGTPHPPPPVGSGSSAGHPGPPLPKEGVILLRPAKRTGARLVLLPLLPPPTPKNDLPPELWARCLRFAMDLSYEKTRSSETTYAKLLKCRRDLILVNKTFRNLISPVLYSHIKIYSLSSLTALHNAVTSGEQRWDNLRRIPYSTPGRWIQSLDISTLSQDLPTRTARLEADTQLSAIVRLTPFLVEFNSDPKLVFSSRALKALAEGCGSRIRAIKGLAAHEDSTYIPSSPWLFEKDPTTALIRACSSSLEVLEIVGPGSTQDEDAALKLLSNLDLPLSPLPLPKLRSLALLGVPNSPLFFTLLHSSGALPSLSRLSLTVYPSRHTPSPSAQFLSAHSRTIASLILTPPPDSPAPDYSTAPNPPMDDFHNPTITSVSGLEEGSEDYYASSILHILPNLENLSVGVPLPSLVLVPVREARLRVLTCPKPVAQLLPFILEMIPPAGSAPGPALFAPSVNGSVSSLAVPSQMNERGLGVVGGMSANMRRRSSSISSNVSRGDQRRGISSSPSNRITSSPLSQSSTSAARSQARPFSSNVPMAGLTTIMWTKAKWLRSDVGSMSRGARFAGEQAEMLKWRRMFAGRGVRLLDADGKEG